VPASFSVLGAWGPAITARFDVLWATEIRKAADNGDPTWPVIRRKLNWRSKVPITLMRANAQMLPLGLLDRKPCALLMPTAPASRISLLTPARPGLFTIAATSLTAVPFLSVLHALALGAWHVCV
jgi:hypothetical protein